MKSFTSFFIPDYLEERKGNYLKKFNKKKGEINKFLQKTDFSDKEQPETKEQLLELKFLVDEWAVLQCHYMNIQEEEIKEQTPLMRNFAFTPADLPFNRKKQLSPRQKRFFQYLKKMKRGTLALVIGVLGFLYVFIFALFSSGISILIGLIITVIFTLIISALLYKNINDFQSIHIIEGSVKNGMLGKEWELLIDPFHPITLNVSDRQFKLKYWQVVALDLYKKYRIYSTASNTILSMEIIN